jgi:hypothetical protein
MHMPRMFATMSHDGKEMLIDNGTTVTLYETATCAPVGMFRFSGQVGLVGEDHEDVLSTSDDDSVVQHDDSAERDDGETKWPMQAAFLEDGAKVVTGSPDGMVPIFERNKCAPGTLLQHGGGSAVRTVHVSESFP